MGGERVEAPASAEAKLIWLDVVNHINNLRAAANAIEQTAVLRMAAIDHIEEEQPQFHRERLSWLIPIGQSNA